MWSMCFDIFITIDCMRRKNPKMTNVFLPKMWSSWSNLSCDKPKCQSKKKFNIHLSNKFFIYSVFRTLSQLTEKESLCLQKKMKDKKAIDKQFARSKHNSPFHKLHKQLPVLQLSCLDWIENLHIKKESVHLVCLRQTNNNRNENKWKK